MAQVVACLCIALVSPGAYAQQQSAGEVPTGPLSLEQVLALAEKRSETIAISRAGVDRADGERARARSERFPQVTGSGSYDRALASEFSDVFDSGDFGGDTGSFEDLPFGRANTWRLSVGVTQNLYTGGRVKAQEAMAEAGRAAADLGVSSTRAQLLFDATQAYYDAALSQRLVTIAEATLEQAGATLRQVQVGFDAGTQPEFEVVRARVSRDSQSPVVIRQRMNRELALLRLRQLLDLPADYPLELPESLADERLPPPAPFAARLTSAEEVLGTRNTIADAMAAAPMPERTVVNESMATLRLREASVQLTEAQRKPTVTMNSTYSRIAYPSDFAPAFDRSNWTVGAAFNVPILTGGRQRADERVVRAELEQARLQLRQTQELAELDSRSAWAELLAARATWEATAGTVQQATRAFQIADVRYQAGVSTQLELTDSRLVLQQAEANRAVAARDFQVARARIALLSDLPIGNTTPLRTPAVQQETPSSTPVPQSQPANRGVITNASTQGGGFQAGTR